MRVRVGFMPCQLMVESQIVNSGVYVREYETLEYLTWCMIESIRMWKCRIEGGY